MLFLLWPLVPCRTFFFICEEPHEFEASINLSQNNNHYTCIIPSSLKKEHKFIHYILSYAHLFLKIK